MVRENTTQKLASRQAKSKLAGKRKVEARQAKQSERRNGKRKPPVPRRGKQAARRGKQAVGGKATGKDGAGNGVGLRGRGLRGGGKRVAEVMSTVVRRKGEGEVVTPPGRGPCECEAFWKKLRRPRKGFICRLCARYYGSDPGAWDNSGKVDQAG